MRKKNTASATLLHTAPIQITAALEAGTPNAVAMWLGAVPSEDITSQLIHLDTDDLRTLALLLSPDLAAKLLEEAGPEASARLVSSVPVTTGAGLLSLLGEDDTSRVLRELDDQEADTLLAAMPLSRSALLRGLLAWPDESVAGWMRPSALRVPADATVADGIAAARKAPDELAEGVFVVGEGDSLLGWVAPDGLVIHDDTTAVADIMVPASMVKQWALPPLADQELAIRNGDRSPVGMAPVVDCGALIGVITRESIDDIEALEFDEDSALQGGSSPLEGSYRTASPLKIWRARVFWLTALFLAEMYTGTVLRYFEDELASVVALSFFIPLLIGTGGNLGTQITTTLIRAIGTEKLRLRDLGRVLVKEFGAGVLLGASMGVLGALRAWSLGVGGPVILTVALTLVCICLWASLVAAMLPLVLKRLGLDPAVVSGPMISTIVDGTGLMIYFTLAAMIVL